MPLTGLANAASRFNISEPFNFHHVTHTRPHHVQALDSSNPNDLVSEFSALRASQASQPGLRGIKAKDIQRQDLPPRDPLLPDCPSPLLNHYAGLPPFHTPRSEGSAPDDSHGAMSSTRILEYSRLTDNFSHPSAGYHGAPASPISPSSPTSSRHLTPDFFMFHNESPSNTSVESPISAEFPGSLDYPMGDGFYDLASPHAVTTDDGADWNRHLPFTMIKTELAPVEEDDETEEDSRLASPRYHTIPWSHFRKKRFPPDAQPFYRVSDACTQVPEKAQGQSLVLTLPAEGPRGLPSGLEEDVSDSLRGHCLPPARVSEPFIEDLTDDIPVRPRFSRCISVGPNDMEGFWDRASDAINWSYALGAEGDSNFDWYRSSIHGDDETVPAAEERQTNDTDTLFESLNRKFRSQSPSPSRTAVNRSSSVYSRSPSPLLPMHTVPSNPDPPSASSTESSFSGFAEAVTPNETMGPATPARFPTMKHKEWCPPTYIMPNDLECPAVQEDVYHQMYAGDYCEEPPFNMPNVGRIDGSTISNSPRSSRSPISKSSSQESFWYSQAAFNTRRPRNAGSVGSLPDLVSSKNSRERFDFTGDQYTDSFPCANPSDSPSDSQQTCAAQRRRSPNLAKDAAQNIMLSKVRTVEEPMPPLPACRSRASSDVTSPAQSSSMAPPAQSAAGRRMRSGSSASNPSARSSGGSCNATPPPHTTSMRNP